MSAPYWSTTFRHLIDSSRTHEVSDVATPTDRPDEANYHAWHLLAVQQGYSEDGAAGIARLFREWRHVVTERVEPTGRRWRAVINSSEVIREPA